MADYRQNPLSVDERSDQSKHPHRRSVAYHLLPASHGAEKAVQPLLEHSDKTMIGLHENLRRWTVAEANQPLLQNIRQTKLATTFREQTE